MLKRVKGFLIIVFSLFMFSVSCETVKAGVVQDEITENGSAQVVRFLLFVDTSNNSILGREKQVLTIHDPNSKQQFSAFHPISPQLPNYKIDRIVNNKPCSWLLADNVNHQATTVYVYMSRVNNKGGKNKNVVRGNTTNNNASGSNSLQTKKVNKKKGKKHERIHNRNKRGVRVTVTRDSEQPTEQVNNDKTFWVITIISGSLGIGLIIFGIYKIWKKG